MKNIFESPEVMGVYVEIDLLYYMLKESAQKYFDNSPKSSLDAAIDKATGYDKKRDIEVIKEQIDILKLIIEQKEIIEAETNEEEDQIIKLKQILEKIESNNLKTNQND